MIARIYHAFKRVFSVYFARGNPRRRGQMIIERQAMKRLETCDRQERSTTGAAPDGGLHCCSVKILFSPSAQCLYVCPLRPESCD